MASNYIKYNNPITNGGNAVYTAINNVLSSWYSLQRIKAEMDQLVGANPVDYAILEPTFGLNTGTGQIFYNTIVGLKANLDIACATLGTVDLIA